MGDADDTADTTCPWDGEEVVEQLGGCWEAVGPPTALQKPGGMDGGRNWELRMWRGGLRVGGRWPFEGFCGSSGLGFTVDCHLIEMFNINCFLNAGRKRRKHIIRPKAIFYRQQWRMAVIIFFLLPLSWDSSRILSFLGWAVPLMEVFFNNNNMVEFNIVDK